MKALGYTIKYSGKACYMYAMIDGRPVRFRGYIRNNVFFPANGGKALMIGTHAFRSKAKTVDHASRIVRTVTREDVICKPRQACTPANKPKTHAANIAQRPLIRARFMPV